MSEVKFRVEDVLHVSPQLGQLDPVRRGDFVMHGDQLYLVMDVDTQIHATGPLTKTIHVDRKEIAMAWRNNWNDNKESN